MTIEFLFAFLPVLALTSLLFSTLLAQADSLGARRGEYLAISGAESAARALEAQCFSSIGRVEPVPNQHGVKVLYRVEDGSLHSDYMGKLVETRGVFEIDGSEPV